MHSIQKIFICYVIIFHGSKMCFSIVQSDVPKFSHFKYFEKLLHYCNIRNLMKIHFPCMRNEYAKDKKNIDTVCSKHQDLLTFNVPAKSVTTQLTLLKTIICTREMIISSPAILAPIAENTQISVCSLHCYFSGKNNNCKFVGTSNVHLLRK
jgi:hypothetical protein